MHGFDSTPIKANREHEIFDSHCGPVGCQRKTCLVWPEAPAMACLRWRGPPLELLHFPFGRDSKGGAVERWRRGRRRAGWCHGRRRIGHGREKNQCQIRRHEKFPNWVTSRRGLCRMRGEGFVDPVWHSPALLVCKVTHAESKNQETYVATSTTHLHLENFVIRVWCQGRGGMVAMHVERAGHGRYAVSVPGR